MPPEETIRFFESKGFKIGFDWRDVWQQEHARAFTVAKVTRLDLLETIRRHVDAAIRDGTTQRQFIKDLTPILQKEGWWGKAPLLDPLTGKTPIVQLGSPRRLAIIYDTNLRTARAAGRWERMERLKDRLPFLRYSAVLDSRTRPRHRAWHGTVLKINNAWWKTHFPPNGWRCRCIAQQFGEADLKRAGFKPSKRAPDDGNFPFINKRTGETINIPRGIDPGFAHNIGQAHMRGVAQSLEGALARGDAAVARQTLDTFVSSEGFSDFLAAPEQWGRAPVMLLDDSLRRRIGAKTPVMNLSADTLKKQREVHPEVIEADYRALAALGRDPDLVIQDGDRTLILLQEGERWLLAVAKATQTGKAGFITSVRRTDQSDIDRLSKRGQIIFRKRG